MTIDISDNAADQWIVVRNHLGQYSICAATGPVPAGWRCDGTRGTREHCLGHIARVWPDNSVALTIVDDER